MRCFLPPLPLLLFSFLSFPLVLDELDKFYKSSIMSSVKNQYIGPISTHHRRDGDCWFLIMLGKLCTCIMLHILHYLKEHNVPKFEFNHYSSFVNLSSPL
jgi:hypothetical protein